MKKYVLLAVVITLLACGGVKKTQQALNSGNYTAVINKALKNLRENKTKKGHQDYVLLLEEAFAKHMAREQERIGFLQQEGNANKLVAVYESYQDLKDLQARIKPLLPLPVYGENRNAHFNFVDYNKEILATKEKLSKHLYQNATSLLAQDGNKQTYRQAYGDLEYLQEINPGYKDVAQKMEVAYFRGLDFVKVTLKNETDYILPKRLETDLLDFNTYDLNNFWMQFHATPVTDVAYDYAMELDFNQINISPEQVSERQLVKEKVIKDGFEYVLDKKGNVAKDSLGNDIKVDRLKTVTCRYYEFTQLKTARLGAKVFFKDLKTGQVINSYPLSSEFIFEHVYARSDGDKRALENELVSFLNLAAVPFPSNEQMVYDAGEDLKGRLKDIINKHQFE